MFASRLPIPWLLAPLSTSPYRPALQPRLFVSQRHHKDRDDDDYDYDDDDDGYDGGGGSGGFL